MRRFKQVVSQFSLKEKWLLAIGIVFAAGLFGGTLLMEKVPTQNKSSVAFFFYLNIA